MIVIKPSEDRCFACKAVPAYDIEIGSVSFVQIMRLCDKCIEELEIKFKELKEIKHALAK